VGRFLQDHFICSPAEVIPKDNKSLAAKVLLVRKGSHRWSQKLRLSDTRQSRDQVLNATASVEFDFDDQEILEPLSRIYRAVKAGRWSQIHGADIISLLRNPLGVIGNGAMHFGYAIPRILQLRRIRLSCISEQAPNRHSRVQLSDTLDPLGVARAKTDWRLTALEHKTIENLVKVCRDEFARLGLAEIVPQGWLEHNNAEWTNYVSPILHPSGTARMASDPKSGVVDENCRVFEVRNLYVASSAVFPTSGSANPALTIASLAIRLADHMKELSSG
jgi:choline dehydrogenase-like flavoprotein